MIGAIAGDIIGSVYEWNNIKTKNFSLFADECSFTDDTVLTVALADSILTGESYGNKMKEYYRRYPDAGYGLSFRDWAESEFRDKPYNSWGNGAAMRISPVGFAFGTLSIVLNQSKKFTAITHNHPEGIKGGQSVASAIWLARNGNSKPEIKKYVETKFGYNLSQRVDEIRPNYKLNKSCQGTVPQAIIAFLESTSFEDAIRNAISIGGDSDTLACITGGIADAFYGGVPAFVRDTVMDKLDDGLRKVVNDFSKRFISNAENI